MKTCKKCKNEFSEIRCRQCKAEYDRINYIKNRNKIRNRILKQRRTIDGYISKTYCDMRKAVRGSRRRSTSLVIGQPILDRDEFIEWSNNNQDYIELYEAWVRSKYSNKLAPTINRIDPRFGFELFNMMWISFSESSKRNIIFQTYGRII